MRKALATILAIAIGGCAYGQANRHELRDGNRSYNKEKYDQAEVSYFRALEQDSMDYRGQYNLGNALYRQKKYGDAARHYEQALASPNLTDAQRANAYHNMGNSHLKAGMETAPRTAW